MNNDKNNLAPLASRGARLLGWVLDGIIATIVAIPLILHFGYFNPERAAELTYLHAAGALVYSLTAFILVQGYFLATSGQTLGKKAAGTRIVDQSTRLILPLHKVFLIRYMPMFLMSIITLIHLIDVLLIFRESKR